MNKHLHGLIGALIVAVGLSAVFAGILHADEEWTPLGGPELPGGRVYEIHIIPNSERVYALVGPPDQLRLFRSEDGGESWSQKAKGLGSVEPFTRRNDSFLAVDPAQPDLVYVAASEGIQRSTDGGGTWEQVYDVGGWVVAPRPNQVYVVGRRSAQSNDGCAENWVFARSPDAGDTWEEIALPCIQQIISMAVSPHDSDLIVVGSADSGPEHRAFVRSENGGRTWEVVTATLFTASSLAFDPQSAGVVYTSDNRRVWISQDNGATWTPCPWVPPFASGNFFDMAVTQEGFLYVAALAYEWTSVSAFGPTYTGIWRSEDHCQSWWASLQHLPPETASTLVAHPAEPRRLYLGWQGAGIWRSDNRGAVWSESNAGIRTLAGVDRVERAGDGNTLYAVTGLYDETRAGLARSSDGGSTWALDFPDHYLRDIAVAPEDAFVWVVNNNGELYSGQGEGAERTWTHLQSLDFDVTSVAISPQDASVRLIGGQVQVAPYKYQARIALWPLTEAEPARNVSLRASAIPTDVTHIYHVAIHPQNPDIMAAVGLQGGMDVALLSRDRGVTWEKFFVEGVDGPTCRPSRIIFNHDRVYMLCFSDVLVSPIYQKGWQLLNFKSGRIYALEFLDDGAPIAATEIGVKLWNRTAWTSIGLDGQQVRGLTRVQQDGQEWLLAGTTQGIWRRPLPAAPPYWIWLPLVGVSPP